MPPDVGTGVTLGRVNIPTHSCLTTQELANAIRLFQVALGVGPAREGDPIYQIVIATEEGDIINANAAGVNTILAAVNEATHVVSTDATFDFDGAVAITGAAPGGGTGTATNSPAESYTDNEQVILLQGDDNSWRVIGRPELNVVYGLSTGVVSSGDSTFQIDNIVSKRGPTPSSPLTVNNTLALTLTDNHRVYAFKNRTGTWDTWADTDTDTGGEGGDTVDIVYFELEEDLSISGTSADATVLTSTAGTTGTITITDPEERFTGLTGYKGYAYDDGSDYHILSMEGISRYADCIATAASSETSETITATLQVLWGNPSNGVAPASLTSVTVYKLPIDADATARYVPLKNGDKFRAIWDEKLGRWKLFWYPGLRIVVRAAYSSGITEATSTITLAQADLGLVSGFVLPADDITVTCDPDCYRTAGVGGYIYAAYNATLNSDPNLCWDLGDARNFLWMLQGIGGYDPAERQFIFQDADDAPVWVTPSNYNGSVNQVLGHDSSGNLKWFDGVTECPGA